MSVTFQGYVNKSNIETWNKLVDYAKDNNCRVSTCMFKGARLLLDYKFSPEMLIPLIKKMNDDELDDFMMRVKDVFKKEYEQREK